MVLIMPLHLSNNISYKLLTSNFICNHIKHLTLLILISRMMLNIRYNNQSFIFSSLCSKTSQVTFSQSVDLSLCLGAFEFQNKSLLNSNYYPSESSL